MKKGLLQMNSRLRKTSITLSALSATALMLATSGCNRSDSENKPKQGPGKKSEPTSLTATQQKLQGDWTHSCQAYEKGGASLTKLEFAMGHVTAVRLEFTDTQCQNKYASFSQGLDCTTQDRANNLDCGNAAAGMDCINSPALFCKYTDFSATFYGDQAVSAANNNGFCEIRDWVSGTSREVTGKNCGENVKTQAGMEFKETLYFANDDTLVIGGSEYQRTH